MPLRMSTYFLTTLRDNPNDAEVKSHQLLVRAGYIRRAAPGIYTWLPLGLRVLRKLEAIVRQEMDTIAHELHFPALLPREPYEATNRWTEYGDNLFRLKDRKDNDYLLAPTHEEMFTLAVKDLFSSYKELPINLYQVQTKYRDEARPRAGLLRGREFIMKDSYSFDIDDAGLEKSYVQHRDVYLRTFARLGLEVVTCAATSGAMGGSRSEEFLHPTEVGEDTFVRSPGGYAANVEAVQTVVPEAPSADVVAAIPALDVRDTPGASTIAALVDYSNEHFGGGFTAADTLKAFVCWVVQPTGEREPLLIGIPGDREIDEKRLEAALAPAEPAAFTEEDFKEFPHLVKGYIGPHGHGEKSASGIRSVVDPRVVDGTEWIAGANEPGKHAYHLVAGRDFVADGILDVAEVLEGDQAPDGSGPLSLARGIEVGHIFQLGRKYAEALGLKVLDENGKQVTVTMGSYGLGVSRVLACIAEANNDDFGLAWPKNVAPLDVHIVVASKEDAAFAAAESLATELEAGGLEVMYDDRYKVSPGVKFKDAELIGIPTIVVIGKSLSEGSIEIKDRKSGEKRSVAVADAAAEVIAQARA